jgi:hypothetical protein
MKSIDFSMELDKCFLLSGLVSGIIGREMCNETITAVISCLTHAQLNRDLALTFLDFFLSQISTSSQQ